MKIDIGLQGNLPEAILRQMRADLGRSDERTAAILGLRTELRAGVDIDSAVVTFLRGIQLEYGVNVTLTQEHDRAVEPDPKGAEGQDPEPLLLTVEQAASRIGIGRTRMFGLVTAGVVKSIALGRSRRIHPDDLAAYVERLREGE